MPHLKNKMQTSDSNTTAAYAPSQSLGTTGFGMVGAYAVYENNNSSNQREPNTASHLSSIKSDNPLAQLDEFQKSRGILAISQSSPTNQNMNKVAGPGMVTEQKQKQQVQV